MKKSNSKEIVKNVYVFGIESKMKEVDSLINKIELELNKSLAEIEIEDINTVKEIILKFAINEQFYIIERCLMAYYRLDMSALSKTVEELFIQPEFKEYRFILLLMADDFMTIDLDKIEEFEKENNITIYKYDETL